MDGISQKKSEIMIKKHWFNRVDKKTVKVYYYSSYAVRRCCIYVQWHVAAQRMCRKGV